RRDLRPVRPPGPDPRDGGRGPADPPVGGLPLPGAPHLRQPPAGPVRRPGVVPRLPQPPPGAPREPGGRRGGPLAPPRRGSGGGEGRRRSRRTHHGRGRRTPRAAALTRGVTI